MRELRKAGEREKRRKRKKRNALVLGVCVERFEQNDRLRFERFEPTDRADGFAGLRFDVDWAGFDAENRRDTTSHRFFKRA